MKRRNSILWTLAAAVVLAALAAASFGQVTRVPTRGPIIQDKSFMLEAALMILDQRGRELEMVVRQQQKDLETLQKELKEQKEKFDKFAKKMETP